MYFNAIAFSLFIMIMPVLAEIDVLQTLFFNKTAVSNRLASADGVAKVKFLSTVTEKTKRFEVELLQPIQSEDGKAKDLLPSGTRLLCKQLSYHQLKGRLLVSCLTAILSGNKEFLPVVNAYLSSGQKVVGIDVGSSNQPNFVIPAGKEFDVVFDSKTLLNESQNGF